jgi:hypothetical protein
MHRDNHTLVASTNRAMSARAPDTWPMPASLVPQVVHAISADVDLCFNQDTDGDPDPAQ